MVHGWAYLGQHPERDERALIELWRKRLNSVAAIPVYTALHRPGGRGAEEQPKTVVSRAVTNWQIEPLERACPCSVCGGTIVLDVATPVHRDEATA